MWVRRTISTEVSAVGGRRSFRMAVGTAALLSAGFLLLLNPGTLAKEASVQIRLSVENDLSNITPESYSCSVVEGGVLLGALRRLQETEHHFKFTVKEHPDFGLLLESVNGVSGDAGGETYWEILSERSGEIARLGVGIGCYAPKADEHIILRLSTWKTPEGSD